MPPVRPANAGIEPPSGARPRKGSKGGEGLAAANAFGGGAPPSGARPRRGAGGGGGGGEKEEREEAMRADATEKGQAAVVRAP